MKKYIVSFTEWGKQKTIICDSYEQAQLEAYQKAKNSEVFINGEQVYKNYRY